MILGIIWARDMEQIKSISGKDNYDTVLSYLIGENIFVTLAV